jgi:hypothetical protein
MNEKLPAPCEAYGVRDCDTGLYAPSASGKGYRLIVNGPRSRATAKSAAMATPGHSAKSSTFPLRLAYSVNRGIPGFMGGASTVLTLVKEGDLWRVQIAWPSGTTHYYGKFGSEREASGWISRHRWLTERGVEGATIRRPWGSVSLRKSVVDVATSESSPEQQEKD